MEGTRRIFGEYLSGYPKTIRSFLPILKVLAERSPNIRRVVEGFWTQT